jgi:hypothetical protein
LGWYWVALIFCRGAGWVNATAAVVQYCPILILELTAWSACLLHFSEDLLGTPRAEISTSIAHDCLENVTLSGEGGLHGEKNS